MEDLILSALQNAIPRPFWLDSVDGSVRGADIRRLVGDRHCDLVIVGGGYAGLWSALLARRRYPDLRVVVIEKRTCGTAASGRNGGFCAPSISRGPANAAHRWPDEADRIIRLGRENLNELQADLEELGVDVEFERTGKITVASTQWQARNLRALRETHRKYGIDSVYVEGNAVRQYVDSAIYNAAGIFERDYAYVNPAKLALALRDACVRAGVDVFEHTAVRSLDQLSSGEIQLQSDYGNVRAARAIVATNAAPPLLRSLRRTIIPVYHYALTTAPLTPSQLRSIGWEGRYGLATSVNQLHYSRKTADDRILWGGYDAIYPFASQTNEDGTQRAETFKRLARQFYEAFPQLTGVSFSHAWGGVIDASARTTMFAGLECRGRLAYALGFSGQGVSATRFAANTMLDLLAGEKTERTSLAMMTRQPVRFPPEPLRYLAVGVTQRSLDHEDKTGKRNWWLKALDVRKIGFGA